MPLFDKKELLDRVGEDWDFLAETIGMLQTDGRALLEEIRRAAETGDAAALGRAGHTLKGMIANFCSPAVQARAFEIEKIGKSGNLSNSAAAVEALSSGLDELTSELDTLMATRA